MGDTYAGYSPRRSHIEEVLAPVCGSGIRVSNRGKTFVRMSIPRTNGTLRMRPYSARRLFHCLRFSHILTLYFAFVHTIMKIY